MSFNHFDILCKPKDTSLIFYLLLVWDGAQYFALLLQYLCEVKWAISGFQMANFKGHM